MKKIKLSCRNKCKNNKLNLVTLVDDEDYEYLSKFNWHLLKGRNTYYAKRTELGNKNSNIKIKMHSEILEAKKGEIIDHIDGNGLNNQRSNLRFCTFSQNSINRIKKSGTSSKYRGVSVYKNRYINKKGEECKSTGWVAELRVGGTRKFIRCFKDEIDAAKAYNEASIKYHGEFARLNIIEE